MARVTLAQLAIAFMLAGCGIGFRRALKTDEMPPGTCARTKLVAGESCIRSAHDYSVGVTVSSPHGHASQVGAAAWVRWPMFHAALDERRVRRGDASYHSLAGSVGTQLRPMLFWPRLQRYVDPGINGGFDLGAIKQNSHLEGRGGAYVAAVLDLYAPDVGPLRYLETGVPGVRIGARYTAYVLGWRAETTFEIGLIWRWGDPVDLYRHWTMQRTGD